jgi:hypothetical protein
MPAPAEEERAKESDEDARVFAKLKELTRPDEDGDEASE